MKENRARILITSHITCSKTLEDTFFSRFTVQKPTQLHETWTVHISKVDLINTKKQIIRFIFRIPDILHRVLITERGCEAALRVPSEGWHEQSKVLATCV